MTRVLVVGGGIVGASIAYHLADAGAAVTVLFRDAGVTASSFAWIGGTGTGWPGGAADLRDCVLPDWRRLAEAVPGVGVRWPGSLSWPAPATVAPGQHLIGAAETAAREPALRTVPDTAVHIPGDGAVDAAAAARALLLAARDRGARLVSGAETPAVTTPPNEITVLAAGTGVTELSGGRVTVPASPAFLIRLRGPAGLVRSVVATPHFEVREDHAGHLLATAPLGRDRTWPGLRALAGDTMQRLRAAFGADLRLTGWSVGERPMPEGGPVIGFLDPSTYVAVMHSAVCLAPAVGRLAAGEILTGRPAPELAGCRR
ncbi:FAD-dependent oxidoreductase [Actinoplanes sp. CA-030573]|uniref:FAD-dependent oxidoreductase n=1 Tax=Actinoplanes sp. CA-030573 TaxID=3239898 RepID=UPI003D938EA1